MFIQTYLKGESLESPVEEYIQVINDDPLIIKQIEADLKEFKAAYDRSAAIQAKPEETTVVPIV